MRRLIRSVTFWFAVVAFVLLVAGLVASVASWEWLHPKTSTTASNSETLRNIGLLIGGVLAFVFALWRGWVAERQAVAAQHQADTAQQSLLNERYERGVEMLGSDILAVRLGGIFALARLAKEHPEEYHIQVIELLCAFLRHPTKGTSIEYGSESDGDQEEQARRIRADVEYAVLEIGSRSVTGIALEQRSKDVKLYLREANLSHLKVSDAKLSGAWLTKANLSGAIFPRADLSWARLRRANFSGAQLRKADLSNAKLWGANLCAVILRGANLSGADFCGVDAKSSQYEEPARGLTQAQLDEACANPDNPPKLDGVLDAKTGKPLVWRGKPCKG